MWKIWFEQFDENGQKIGAGVCTREYKYKRNAERMAKERYGDRKDIKYIVSQTNPWEVREREYIDRNILFKRLDDFTKWCKDGRKEGVDFVLDCILPNIENADVVPKAEAPREIFEWIDNNASNLNFLTGNFEINLGMYLDFKKRYKEDEE